jgi:hypothetical protein
MNVSLRAGICKQSMGARNRVGIGLSYRTARLHMLAELIPLNRLWGSLKIEKFGLWSDGFFDLNTSTRARIVKLLRSPRIDSKGPSPPGCVVRVRICRPFKELAGGIDSLGSIPGLLKRLQIWALAGRYTATYSVPSPHRLFKNSSTETERLCYAVPSAQSVLND